MSRCTSQPASPGFLAVVALVVVTLFLVMPGSSFAVHEGDTILSFEPVADSPSPGGFGDGKIEFRGGAEPVSRWTTTFRFTGLEPGARYIVLVQGQFGEDGLPEAEAFTTICGFGADDNGEGGCWYYLVGLRRLATIQVQLDDGSGTVALQATRADGPGSMAGMTNRYSFPLTVAPSSPVGSPIPSGTPMPAH